MEKYGLRSAIFTSIFSHRAVLKSKEAVRNKYLAANDADFGNEKYVSSRGLYAPSIFKSINPNQSINDDLESFYTNLQNQERKIKKEETGHFLTQKITPEEQDLIDKRDENYKKSFERYLKVMPHGLKWFEDDIEEFKKSSDPDSKYVYSFSKRFTFPLNVTLKSTREAMTKRAFNENLSDMELKRSIYTCNIDKKRKYTYKYVKKQKMNSSNKK